jgi:CMP-N,N'-diacetyllegionaminic acid synthase
MLVVGLIPARGGSVRIHRKNIKPLGGKPLICWTIDAARESGIFTDLIVSTDDAETAEIADRAGVRVHLRDACFARDNAPDIGWVRAVMAARHEDCFAILRPTSPFRTAGTIRRAWTRFQDQQPCDSLRAVEPVRQHPGKMWYARRSHLPGGTSANPAMGSAVIRDRLVPVMPQELEWVPGPGQVPVTVPWHSAPTQSLPAVFAQNASLEIAWRYVALPPALAVAGTWMDDGTIAGEAVCPFFTSGWEGFDINTPEDWERAEAHVAETASLARVSGLSPAQ